MIVVIHAASVLFHLYTCFSILLQFHLTGWSFLFFEMSTRAFMFSPGLSYCILCAQMQISSPNSRRLLKVVAEGAADAGISNATRGSGSSLDQVQSSLFDAHFGTSALWMSDYLYCFQECMTLRCQSLRNILDLVILLAICYVSTLHLLSVLSLYIFSNNVLITTCYGWLIYYIYIGYLCHPSLRL